MGRASQVTGHKGAAYDRIPPQGKRYGGKDAPPSEGRINGSGINIRLEAPASLGPSMLKTVLPEVILPLPLQTSWSSISVWDVDVEVLQETLIDLSMTFNPEFP